MNTPNFPCATLAEDDVNTCVRVLRAIEADRSLLTALTQERRRELLTLAGLVTRPERHDVTRMAKAFRRADREAAKQHDREVSDSAGLRVQRRAEVYTPLWLEPPGPQEADDRPAFQQARACYVCKQPYDRVHRYYDSLCEACGEFNYAKRGQSADLSGHYAVISGARVKIGFQAALKLLRAGAHVTSPRVFPSMQPSGTRRSRTIRRFVNGCRFMGSIFATRRASSCSRASWSSAYRGSIT